MNDLVVINHYNKFIQKAVQTKPNFEPPFVSRRSKLFTIIGDNVDVGQGCIFVGNNKQILSSYGFETCAPFIMLSKDRSKNILGHIDSQTDPREIVQAIKNNFAPKEIENASFIYMKGAASYERNKNLCYLATNTIEKALNMLDVRGKRIDALTTGFEDVIVNAKGLFIKEGQKLIKLA